MPVGPPADDLDSAFSPRIGPPVPEPGRAGPLDASRGPIDADGAWPGPVSTGPVRGGRRGLGAAGDPDGAWRRRVDRLRPDSPRRRTGTDGDLDGRRHSTGSVALLSAIAVIVLLAVCGIGAYFVVKDEKDGPVPNRAGSPAATSVPRDISSRTVDPAPLTEREVFPAAEIVPAPDAKYAVLKTQVSEDCRLAAADDLGTLLSKLGCSQVVRGTLKSPNGQYLVTAGVFNLIDEAAANQAKDAIKPTVDAQKGRFTGLLAGAGSESIVRAPAQLGWNPRGHFLVYCVIVRVDGKPIEADDVNAKQIAFDLIETHLRDTVIGKRAVQPIGPSVKPSAGS